jgi:CheY-like chemotaxis protein
MGSSRILHVEDEPDDAFFVDWAFRQARPDCSLFRVESGEQAIDYLNGAGPYSERARYPLPDLVLLDLKLPGSSGFDVLAWARGQSRFRDLPIVILSGSSLPEDKEKAAKLGANLYMVKTPLYEDVVDSAMRLL